MATLLLVASACGATALGPIDESVRVTFLDVGQADAILIRSSEGQTALVDAGRSSPVPALKELGVEQIDLLVATHPHADHITAAPHLKQELGGQIGIGIGICQVHENFKSIFNFGDDFATDGRQFDHLFEEGEDFSFGGATGKIWSCPGHTPACVCYLIDDAIFVGDTIFMPDFGSARCDFPDGDARTLFRSVKRLLSLPPETRLFMCHDYGPGGRAFRWETTVEEQRQDNKHMRDGVDEEEFVAMRIALDGELDMPVLLLPAIQINIRSGHFPPAEDNGISYLKMPLNAV